MLKLLSISRRSRRQTTILALLVGLALINSTAFGQGHERPLPIPLVGLAERVDRSELALGQTAFAYQGQLREGGMPANGAYDIQFTLYTARAGGVELKSVVHEDVVVINGQFTVKLDFGRAGFDSKESWLEVAVRAGYSTDAFTSLSPRQRLTPTPYAILAQRDSWSLIGVPVGFAEGMSEAAAVDPLKGESDKAETSGKKEETPGEVKTAAAAALGAQNFIAKFDAAGNATANSIMFDNGAGVGIGTTTPFVNLDVKGQARFYTESAGKPGIELAYRADLNWNRILSYDRQNNRYKDLFIEAGDDVTGVMIKSNGNLGIGTTNPNAKLHISGIGVDNNGSTAVVRITSGNGAQNLLLDGNEIDAIADGLFLNHNTNQKVILGTGGGNVGVGTANPAAKLHVAGTTRTGVLEITGGSDLAEPFEVGGAEAIKPGMVVAIDAGRPGSLRLADKAYDRTVAGIVSGANGINPGLTMRQEGTVADGSMPVALTGRVYCWADATYGPIKPGDLLTTSATAGHAMKVANHRKSKGAIIGKAMTSLTAGRGLVLVLVTLQ
jgi:hypothetical protein